MAPRSARGPHGLAGRAPETGAHGLCGIISAMPLVFLFTFLTLAFTGIAVGAATASRWVIALAAAAIAAWMATFAWAAVRRIRR
jgi:hypothetical protein